MEENMNMSYDPDTDVVRIVADESEMNSVAVPLEDLTVLVSADLDRIVGINIQDLPTFVSRYVADQLIPPEARYGEELFRASCPHLQRLACLFLANLGPLAKDQIAQWDEQVEAIINRRAPH